PGRRVTSAKRATALSALLKVDWTGWEPWTRLKGLDLLKVPTGPGAYIVATNRGPVARAVGKDAKGLLDVGESGNLRDRLWGFLECIEKPEAEWHRAGWRFTFFDFARHFPVASLRVRWCPTKDKDAAVRLEGQILLAYLRRHCELPPLNYQFNWTPF